MVKHACLVKEWFASQWTCVFVLIQILYFRAIVEVWYHPLNFGLVTKVGKNQKKESQKWCQNIPSPKHILHKCVKLQGICFNAPKWILTLGELEVSRCPKYLEQCLRDQLLSKLKHFSTIEIFLNNIKIKWGYNHKTRIYNNHYTRNVIVWLIFINYINHLCHL
jgi:hypothetical protein